MLKSDRGATGQQIGVLDAADLGAVATISGALVRNTAHSWWNAGNGAWLDRIEIIDLGADPTTRLAAAAGDAIGVVFPPRTTSWSRPGRWPCWRHG